LGSTRPCRTCASRWGERQPRRGCRRRGAAQAPWSLVIQAEAQPIAEVSALKQRVWITTPCNIDMVRSAQTSAGFWPSGGLTMTRSRCTDLCIAQLSLRSSQLFDKFQFSYYYPIPEACRADMMPKHRQFKQ
jgi:hypothetical protein